MENFFEQATCLIQPLWWILWANVCVVPIAALITLGKEMGKNE